MRKRAGIHGVIPLFNSKIRDTRGIADGTREEAGGWLDTDLKSAQCRFESDWGHAISAG